MTERMIVIHPATAETHEAEVIELAVAAFGQHERARRWLNRPRREFGGISPLEMLDTPAGTRQVLALLRGMVAARDGSED
jgi:uncharacterized protein (DUF2384 family)